MSDKGAARGAGREDTVIRQCAERWKYVIELWREGALADGPHESLLAEVFSGRLPQSSSEMRELLDSILQGNEEPLGRVGTSTRFNAAKLEKDLASRVVQEFRDEGGRPLSDEDRKGIEMVLERTLNRQEQRVLKLRFGLSGEMPRTLRATGAEVGLSGERMRQIEAKALRKLRHPLRRNQLRRYWSWKSFANGAASRLQHQDEIIQWCAKKRGITVAELTGEYGETWIDEYMKAR